jgi:hypothetical protein
MMEPRPRTVPNLLGDAIRETRELVSTEVVLFRAEMTVSLDHLTWGLSLFIAASVFAMAGVVVLILALVADRIATPSSGKKHTRINQPERGASFNPLRSALCVQEP